MWPALKRGGPCAESLQRDAVHSILYHIYIKVILTNAHYSSTDQDPSDVKLAVSTVSCHRKLLAGVVEELPIVCSRQPVDHLQLRIHRLRWSLHIEHREARFDHTICKRKTRRFPRHVAWMRSRRQPSYLPRSEGRIRPFPRTHFRLGVDHARADGDDGKPLRLELDGPLDCSYKLRGFGHPVRRHVIHADTADEPGNHSPSAYDHYPLRVPRTQEGEERCHAVNEAEGIDFVLIDLRVRG